MSISSVSSLSPITASVRPQARPTEANSLEIPSQTPADSVALSDESNPYQGVGAGSTQVEVEAWSGNRAPGEGQVSRNDHLEGILRNSGYSVEDIYRPDQDGKTLLDRVAEVNDLQNPNLLQPGQRLIVPTMEAPEPSSFDALLGGLMDNYAPEQPESPESSAPAPAAPSADAAPEIGQAPELAAAPAPDSPPPTQAPPAPAQAEEAFPTMVGEQATVVAEAQGDGAEAEASATTPRLENSSLSTIAQAVGDDSSAEATTTVGSLVGSYAGATAIALGEGAQAQATTESRFADQDSVLAATAIAPQGTAQAQVVNEGPIEAGHAEVTALGGDGAIASAQGTATAALEVGTENGMALAEVDAGLATVAANGHAAGVVMEGHDNTAQAQIDAAGTALVADDGFGNTTDYQAQGQSIVYDGRAHTGSFNGTFNATGEENHLSGQLAAEGVNSAQLGSGDDSARFLSFGDGDQSFDIFKNGGSFVMPNNTGAAEGARTQLGVWAPGTEIGGYTNGGRSDDSWTIDAGSLADGAGVNGRAGQDSLTLRVPVGQLPAIRTENNWFSDQYLVAPENGNGATFDALNMENICVYEGDTLAAAVGDCAPTWAAPVFTFADPSSAGRSNSIGLQKRV
jgi:LysM repeat protein